MKKFLLILIIIIAIFLRIWHLDLNPPSLYWDEASLGYNAYSILLSGADEHGEKLPLDRFIAFGDYKPPGYIYSTVFSMAVFGPNEFAVRFPSAMGGILMVILTYFLTKKLLTSVKVFLLAKGVESEAGSEEYNVKEQVAQFISKGGQIYACGTCMKSRQMGSRDTCPLSSMSDLYKIIKESDKVLTF